MANIEIKMTDYSNYSFIDSDDLSEEDNIAGAYGGYDELYDVMEVAGYDAWDIGDPWCLGEEASVIRPSDLKPAWIKPLPA